MAKKNTGDKLHSEKNFSRDPYVFRPPSKKDTEHGNIKREVKKNIPNHKNEYYPSAIVYHWTDDKQPTRNFIIPRELASDLDNLYFARDVLAAVTTLYVQNPNSLKIVTTFSQLCKLIGISPNGENFDRINLSFAILRSYTIQEQKVPLEIRQDCTVAKWGTINFGFIDYTVAVTHIGKDIDHLKPLPFRKRSLEIVLSPQYRKLLELSGTCLVPRNALDKARSLPCKQVIPAKNLVYYLSARSGNKAELYLETLAEIMNVHGRWPKETQNTVENVLGSMSRKRIIEYQKDEHTGKPVKIKVKLLVEE